MASITGDGDSGSRLLPLVVAIAAGIVLAGLVSVRGGASVTADHEAASLEASP
jgi:hypothetical protein